MLRPTPKKTKLWTGDSWLPAPWGTKSVKQLLGSGKTVDQVVKTRMADHLIQIYTLIYETKDADLTPLTRKIVEGKLAAQFRAAPKHEGAKWELP